MHETMNETLSHYLIVSHKFEKMSQSIKKRQIQERCVKTEREQKSRPAYNSADFDCRLAFVISTAEVRSFSISTI
jgi:hypothetical protein